MWCHSSDCVTLSQDSIRFILIIRASDLVCQSTLGSDLGTTASLYPVLPMSERWSCIREWFRVIPWHKPSRWRWQTRQHLSMSDWESLAREKAMQNAPVFFICYIFVISIFNADEYPHSDVFILFNESSLAFDQIRKCLPYQERVNCLFLNFFI